MFNQPPFLQYKMILIIQEDEGIFFLGPKPAFIAFSIKAPTAFNERRLRACFCLQLLSKQHRINF